MRLLIALLLLAVLAACSDPDTAGKSSLDAGADSTSAPDASVDDADVSSPEDIGPDSEGGACPTESPCCIGGEPVSVGAPCDDGLECTVGTTCQPDGQCGGATGSPCDAQLEHPDCQAATCDEVAGCTIEPVREGFECDDGDDGTYDETCQAGQCVGKACECDSETECCDGCFAQNEGSACDDGDGIPENAFCSSGACVQEPCECDESDGFCCDGCHWKTGLPCNVGSHRNYRCETSQCGGDVLAEQCLHVCTPEDNYECTGVEVTDCQQETYADCPASRRCGSDSSGEWYCQMDSSC